MSAIYTATNDLLKHYIISHEWASDKHTNTLMNGLILSILASVSTFAFWQTLYYNFMIISHTIPCISRLCKVIFCWKRKQTKTYEKHIVTQDMLEKIRKYAEKKIKTSITWYTGNKEFTEGIANFILSNYDWKYKSYVFYDMETELPLECKGGVWRQFINSTHVIDEIFPIFIENGEVICIKKVKDGSMVLCSTDIDFLKKFIRFIKTNFSNKTINALYHYSIISLVFDSESNYTSNCTTLYPDRNMNKFVSKYKSLIIRYLDDFLAANNNKSIFGGHGTYNFGLILYGPPGTGKTSLIRAIANYVDRSIVMLNLREIKSMKKLHDICEQYKPNFCVYAFEEFDFVQNIFEQNPNTEKNEIRSRIISLLGTMHKDLDADGRKAIQEQITKEEQRLAELNDAITLDNLLLFMDGLQEVRGRIIIATTNNIGKINPVLLREGRFDLKIKLDLFNHEEITELLIQMFPEGEKRIKSVIFPHEKFSCAEIISLCHKYRELDTVLEELKAKEKTN